jgi:hypothetical protein
MGVLLDFKTVLGNHSDYEFSGYRTANSAEKPQLLLEGNRATLACHRAQVRPAQLFTRLVAFEPHLGGYAKVHEPNWDPQKPLVEARQQSGIGHSKVVPAASQMQEGCDGLNRHASPLPGWGRTSACSQKISKKGDAYGAIRFRRVRTVAESPPERRPMTTHGSHLHLFSSPYHQSGRPYRHYTGLVTPGKENFQANVVIGVALQRIARLRERRFDHEFGLPNCGQIRLVYPNCGLARAETPMKIYVTRFQGSNICREN